MKCPCCGAAERLGVWLPPKKLPIFDLIVRAKEDGISSYWLCDLLNIERSNLKQHIHQINNLLEETDYAIRGENGNIHSHWRLVKVR